MDTLISDISGELGRYLTVVEDNLLNYQANDKTKNIKTAVKLRDWKSILYYLYRYDFNINIMRNAYFGACYIGDLNLMRLFFQPNNCWEYDAFKYFITGGQDALLEQYRKRYPYYDTTPVYRGLLKIWRVDEVRLKKYGPLKPGGEFRLLYTVGKYNIPIDLDFDVRITNLEKTRHVILGKIRSRKYFRMDDYNGFKILIGYTRLGQIFHWTGDVVRELAHYGWHDICDQILETEPNKYSDYIQGLISGKWVEKFEELISKESLHSYAEHGIRYYKAKMAIMLDDLKTFREHGGGLNASCAISLMIGAKASRVLEYGLGNYIDPYENINRYMDDIIGTTDDPRIAKLLAKKLNKPVRKYFHKVRCNF